MRIWTPVLAFAVAGPVLAQQGAIEVQPLDPLVPGATQNNDGGSIIVRPVEPLGESGAAGGGAVTRSAPGQPSSEADILSEGFNDDAFGEGGDESGGLFEDEASGAPEAEASGAAEAEGGLFGDDGSGEGDSFIDRAFGSWQTPPAEGNEKLAPNAEDAAGDSAYSEEPAERHPLAEWFGLGGEEDLGDDPLIQALPGEGEDGADDDSPRFMTAPFTTRGLFGPNRPTALPRVATVPAEAAEIRQLDKMTGATRTVSMKVGQEQELGRLRVRLEGCHAPPGGDTHGTVAFLRVWDPQRDESEPVFSGWMFAESPALSALDHPRYDLWVLECTLPRAAGAEPVSVEDPGEG